MTTKSIRSSWCKYYAILQHQMPTLLFYHIILQHLIYQISYNPILYIKIILILVKVIYYPLPHYHQQSNSNSNNNPHRRSIATTHNHRPPPQINHRPPISKTATKKKNSNKHYNQNSINQNQPTRSTQTQTPISTQISHPQPDQPTTINQNQPTINNQNNQPPKKRDRDWRDRSSDDDGDDDNDDDVDDRSGLAYTACASDGDDDGNDPIGVASPIKMICFSSDPIRVSFCSFSIELLRDALVWCEKRERRNQESRLEVRGEREANIKHYLVLPHLSVSLQICNGTDKCSIILAHMPHLMWADFCV